MNEVLKKISNGQIKFGSFIVNQEFRGKNSLPDFEEIYNHYSKHNKIICEFKFNNSYYFFGEVSDSTAKKHIQSFEYIDEDK